MGTHANFSHRKQNEQQGFIHPSLPASNIVTKKCKVKNVEEWVKQIWYYRKHLDVCIEEFFSSESHPINLFPFQKVILRQYGNCQFIDDVESRGLGKTFKAALALLVLSVLYPNSEGLVVSKTARQAMLTIKYIRGLAEKNDNIAREIKSSKITKDYACVILRNGSIIEAMAMSIDGSNIRGLRKKFIYIDESAWVQTQVVNDVLMPMLQKKRDVYWKLQDQGFEDFESKFIQTSSAYLKSCEYFERFKQNLIDMKSDSNKFVCALPYTIGVRYGILTEDFILAQKKQMPANSFEMEWNARFIGAAEGACFPYDLTEPCRTLDKVELVQPKRSQTDYVLSFDIATSSKETADNACACLLKIPDNPNGTYKKHLVYMRTYHGFKLEQLAEEIRILCIRFPNIKKIIIDTNALGEGMISLLNNPFVSDENKEYPPLLPDDSELTLRGSRIIRCVRADNKYNNRMATATRMYLENKSLKIPLTSANLRRDFESEENKKMTKEKLAIYIEADALQYEMGNIVSRITHSGNVVYETSSTSMLKDRYSALGMALEYIMELENLNKKQRNKGNEIYFGCACKM